MNWEIFAAIGEVAGALGVLAALFYLARQIAHSSKIGLIAVKQ